MKYFAFAGPMWSLVYCFLVLFHLSIFVTVLV